MAAPTPTAPAAHAAARALRQDLAVVGAFWTLVTLGLAFSAYLDKLRLDPSASLLQALSIFMPQMLPQVSFSLAVAVWLHGHRAWLEHPRRLVALALAVLPLYLLLSTPTVVAIGLLTRGKAWSEFGAALSNWAAINIWVDAMTASAGLALQMGWAFWRHAQRQRETALQAQADNLRLRLSLLQGQLEPHFLFNTLNSISALVRGAERAVALQALNRLSELLRYALRASQRPVVSVADELQFVADYVALQRLRFGDALQWQAEVDAEDWACWACPPLLLQPLVENAIRHGLEAGPTGPLHLVMRREEAQLALTLSNPRAEGASLMPGHGLGLAKTRERLEVLYGGRALLRTEVQPDRFTLHLTLPLEDLDAALEAADR